MLNLGTQPLANDFRREGEPRAGFAPLEVLFCPRCALAQLSVVVDPTVLYSRYSYVTSPSATMRKHFLALHAEILAEQQPGPVVEIGSNDGLFLAFLSDNGYGNLVGIDPAKNLAAHASEKGIITVNDFFNVQSARTARDTCGEVSVVIARHVFCHIDDWHEFLVALDVLASKDTLICIEVPCVLHQLNSGSFDQIYHEHLSYLPTTAMHALMKDSGFHLHRIVQFPVHGGALLMMIRRNDCLIPPHPSVESWLESDHTHITLQRWQAFAAEAELQIIRLRERVLDLVAAGKRVCGYGASAKSTVWINACHFNKKHIQRLYDCTEEKQYCCTPGTDIPIAHEGAFYADAFDYAVLFSWNYSGEIIQKQKKWMAGGGRFIVPVPKLIEIGLDSLPSEA